jgi:flagellar basal-body rod protein FlgC
MDVISENIANINTTRTETGGSYRRKTVLFRERETPFGLALGEAQNRFNGVKVSRVVEDDTPGTLVYEPEHPDANADGYVLMPNVNVVREMVDMISASRSYEANVTAMNVTKAMMNKTIDIGR